VGTKSFLSLLVRQLRNQGIRRVVMCSGYLSEQIESEFGDGRDWDMEIQYSRETQPLGTGGAVKFAERLLNEAPEFLAMNGDSFVELDLGQLVQVHREEKSLVTMAVVPVDNAVRYGTVKIDSNRRVIGFTEKTGSDAPGLINAGVYVFGRSIFEHIPSGASSLERDIFPTILHLGVVAFEQPGMFIDIGTPEDYARAQAICDRLSAAASRARGDAARRND